LEEARLRVYEARIDIVGIRKEIIANYYRDKLPIIELPAGVCHVVAKNGVAKSSANVRVKAGEVTEATIVVDGGGCFVGSLLTASKP
jgi:hypothetical protein